MPLRVLPSLLFLFLQTPTIAATGNAAPAQLALLGEVRIQARQDAQSNLPQRQSQELQVLFGDEAHSTGTAMRLLIRTYEAEYTRSKPRVSWWNSFLPRAGWVTAGLMFLLLLFKDFVSKGFASLLDAAQERIYQRFAGHRLFRRKALRSYRDSLRKRYCEIVLPFRPGQSLQMSEVYVPLRAQGEGGAELIEAQSALAQYDRLMVVGLPGAGKSMLVKNILLSYAEGKLADLPPKSIPVLLELNRLNEGTVVLRDRFVEALELNGFPHGESFVDRSLKEAALVLLFDGLDEVNSTRRDTVVRSIIDLMNKHQGCRAIITCRSAVYHNDFLQAVDQTLEIAEFSDQQVQRFLASWRCLMPEGKSIPQLLRALRERPQIMALARNPLMLTIIAFLYTEPAFILPHSRAEFYDQAIGVLFLQKQGTHNAYKAPLKRLVLQHLALFNQSTGSQDRQDRRSIDLSTVLREVKLVLPDLNLREEDAHPIIDEIVERSGLLLAIDGGERYQFAHLTLQEFFAAKALESRADELFSLFARDRDAWRETVKLWCGLDHDCTELVRRVFESDPIAAFEGLADAHQISAAVANQIVDHFKERLGDAGGDTEAILRAFAALASDSRPRGRAVFDFMVNELTAGVSAIPTAAVVTILSFTNTRRAAEVLAARYTSLPEARTSLARMGDLAVPLLFSFAQEGKLAAIEDLGAIGTPEAAVALASFLWDDFPFRTEAAIYLSRLLGRIDAEEALRDSTLSDEQRQQKALDWAWAPFQESQGSSLPVIAGRIAYLVDAFFTMLAQSSEVKDIPLVAPEIILPLAVRERRDLKKSSVTYLSQFGLERSVDDEELGVFINDVFPRSGPTRKLNILLNALDQRHKRDVFRRLSASPAPNLDDWRHIFLSTRYQFATGKCYRGAVALVALATLSALLGIGRASQ